MKKYALTSEAIIRNKIHLLIDQAQGDFSDEQMLMMEKGTDMDFIVDKLKEKYMGETFEKYRRNKRSEKDARKNKKRGHCTKNR